MCLSKSQILVIKRAGGVGANDIKQNIKRVKLVTIATILSKVFTTLKTPPKYTRLKRPQISGIAYTGN